MLRLNCFNVLLKVNTQWRRCAQKMAVKAMCLTPRVRWRQAMTARRELRSSGRRGTTCVSRGHA